MEILGTFDCPLIQEKLKFLINLFILAKLLDLAKDLEADFFRWHTLLGLLNQLNLVDDLLAQLRIVAIVGRILVLVMSTSLLRCRCFCWSAFTKFLGYHLTTISVLFMHLHHVLTGHSHLLESLPRVNSRTNFAAKDIVHGLFTSTILERTATDISICI